MRFYTHLASGIFVSSFIIFVPYNILILIGSILPDIDIATSKLGKKFKFFSYVFDHRGFLHSIFGAMFFSLLIYPFGRIYSIFLFIGYILHLMSDSWTIKGIMPFYPLRFRIRGFIKTGSINEKMLLLLLIALSAVNIYRKF